MIDLVTNIFINILFFVGACLILAHAFGGKWKSDEIRYIIIILIIALFVILDFPLSLDDFKNCNFKIFLFEYIEALSAECGLIALFATVAVVSYSIQKKIFYGTKKGIIICIILTIIGAPSAWLFFGGGIEHPGALFEKSEYQGTYIVAMSRKPETENSRTVYYLPAHISKFSGVFYHIDKLYFNNGGYLTFEEENIVFLDKEVKIYDYKGDRYYITLTTEKADIKN